MSVALLTCQVLPEPDPDEAPLLDALRAAGVCAEMVAWDDPSADAGGFDYAVVRSTWNYAQNLEAFREWLSRAERATRILNPPDVLRTNLHKGYLVDLAEAGVPVVPTRLVRPGEAVDVDGADVVIKPAVSAGSWRTRRFRGDAAGARGFLASLLDYGDALVQPYMDDVDRGGERALVWIDGEWTHAIRKSPRFADEHETVSDALEPTAEEKTFGENVLAQVAGDLLYARVDVVRDGDDRLRLCELELLEPSLFFLQHPPALERFVETLASLPTRRS